MLIWPVFAAFERDVWDLLGIFWPFETVAVAVSASFVDVLPRLL